METRIRALGYEVSQLVPDGKLRRFPHGGSKDAGWIRCWQNLKKDGTFFLVALVGDWISGDRHVIKPDDLDPKDARETGRQIKARMKDIDAEERRKHDEVATAVAAFWETNPSLEGLTPYLEQKQLPGSFGAAVIDDRVIVPARDLSGKIWGQQTIFPDGSKRFSAGMRKKGTCFVIGPDLGSGVIHIVEGYATGASVYMATGGTVVVAWDAGGLAEMSSQIRKKHKDSPIIICGDDDTRKEKNRGRTDAEAAAKACRGSTVFPEFEQAGAGTDFNDLHRIHGLDCVREQIAAATPSVNVDGEYFVPLGHADGTFYFYVFAGRVVRHVRNFNTSFLAELAPLDFWRDNFPTSGKSEFSQFDAIHSLITKCYARGQFDYANIRGCGAWEADGKVVYNTGREVVVAGETLPIRTYDGGSKRYVESAQIIPSLHAEPLTEKECEPLCKLANMFNWSSADCAADDLLGWIAISRITGAYNIRPHVWISGPSGSGKSTILEEYILKLLGSDNSYLFRGGVTTAPGVRQSLCNRSIPVVIDEVDANKDDAKGRVYDLVELARIAWKSTGSYVSKGTPNGQAIHYHVNSPMLFLSIRVSLNIDADANRFTHLSLDPNNGVMSDEMIDLLRHVTVDLGERLQSRMIRNADQIFRNARTFKLALVKAGCDSRYADQKSVLLAGRCAYYDRDDISAADAATVASMIKKSGVADEKDFDPDHIECLSHLLRRKISVTIGTSRIEYAIGDLILHRDPPPELRLYGIVVADDAVIIADSHPELAQLFSSTRWSSGWKHSLRMIPTAAKVAQKKIAGKNLRCTQIPLAVCRTLTYD